MSGGSYEYAYHKVSEFAQELVRQTKLDHPHRASRLAFAKHVGLVAEAMKAVEWEDSGDTGEGSSVPLMRRAMGKDAPQQELLCLIEQAGTALLALEEGIRRAEAAVPKGTSGKEWWE